MNIFYLSCNVEQNLNRVVGLIMDVDINVFPPPDEDPAHVDDEGHKIVLSEHWL